MKEIVLTFLLLAGLLVIAPIVILLKIIIEAIANMFSRCIGWITSFVPSWIKGK